MIDTLKPGAEDITLSQVFKTETDFCRRYIGVFFCFVLMEVWELEEWKRGGDGERGGERERQKHSSDAGLSFANNTLKNQILIRVSSKNTFI